MKLVSVDEVDGGAGALHLHHSLPRPHSVEHGASVRGALTLTAPPQNWFNFWRAGRSSEAALAPSARVWVGSAVVDHTLNTRHRGRSVLAPAPSSSQRAKKNSPSGINHIRARGNYSLHGNSIRSKGHLCSSTWHTL